jgi:protein TonB
MQRLMFGFACLACAVFVAAPQWSLAADGSLTPPVALPGHVCHNYPHGALWDNAQGSARVRFLIETDGTVKDIVIVKSTGNSDLDQAALICAAAFRYKPATRDGVPVNWSWEADLNWMIDAPPGAPCRSYATVTPEILSGIRGETNVTFSIMPDGTSAEAEVTRSSGNDTLDQAALACIGKMRFDTTHAAISSKGLVQRVSIDWRVDLPPEAKATKNPPVETAPAPDVPAGPAKKKSLVENASAPAVPDGTTPPEASQLVLCTKQSDPAVPSPGPTEVSFTVGVDGSVRDLSVTKSSGSYKLDNAASSCIANWKYTPASKDGRPVEVHWSEHINWQRG